MRLEGFGEHEVLSEAQVFVCFCRISRMSPLFLSTFSEGFALWVICPLSLRKQSLLRILPKGRCFASLCVSKVHEQRGSNYWHGWGARWMFRKRGLANRTTSESN